SPIQALAQCERALGHYPRAIELFREYLATRPPPADAPPIEKTIGVLEQKVKSERPLGTARGGEPQPAIPRTPGATGEPDPFLENARLGWGRDPEIAPAVTPVQTAETAEAPITSQPAFWLICGGVEAAAAASIALTFALKHDSAEP